LAFTFFILKSTAMNSTHIHLLLNHFPIIGTLIGSLLLLWGVFSKQNNIKTVAAIVIVAMTLIAIPVYLTGEPAEEAVENLPGFSESLMEMHEDAANIAIWLMGITGLFSLVAIFMQMKQSTKAAALFTLAAVFSVISFAAMARTGYYGGKIRHTEIRSAQEPGATQASDAENGTGEKMKSAEDDD
jgi:uncharacterized membrane protein